MAYFLIFFKKKWLLLQEFYLLKLLESAGKKESPELKQAHPEANRLDFSRVIHHCLERVQ